MPRSRSSSIESSSCGRWSRGSTAPVISRMRSASVDFPWSMWAMIEKLRMLAAGAAIASRLAAPREQRADLAHLRHAHDRHRGDIDGGAGGDRDSDRRGLREEGLAQEVVEPVPGPV